MGDIHRDFSRETKKEKSLEDAEKHGQGGRKASKNIAARDQKAGVTRRNCH